jgi:hypothetical protein
MHEKYVSLQALYFGLIADPMTFVVAAARVRLADTAPRAAAAVFRVDPDDITGRAAALDAFPRSVVEDARVRAFLSAVGAERADWTELGAAAFGFGATLPATAARDMTPRLAAADSRVCVVGAATFRATAARPWSAVPRPEFCASRPPEALVFCSAGRRSAVVRVWTAGAFLAAARAASAASSARAKQAAEIKIAKAGKNFLIFRNDSKKDARRARENYTYRCEYRRLRTVIV